MAGSITRHPDLPCSPYPPISAFYPGIFARTRPYPNTLLTRCGYDRILFAVPATNIVHANTFARIRPVYRIYPRYTQRACFFACIHAIRGEYIEYACRPASENKSDDGSRCVSVSELRKTVCKDTVHADSYDTETRWRIRFCETCTC